MTQLDEAALAECREAFEREMVKRHPKGKLRYTDRDWELWQAAYSSRPREAAPEVVERIRERLAQETIGGDAIEASWYNEALEMAGNIVAEELSALPAAREMSEERELAYKQAIETAIEIICDSYGEDAENLYVFSDCQAVNVLKKVLRQHATITEKE